LTNILPFSNIYRILFSQQSLITFLLTIAVSGKGGVGKTTLTAALSKLFADEGRKVIAIDADKITPLVKLEEYVK